MKNIKISKKFLSMLTAGMLMATPVVGHTEKNNEENSETSFKLVQQIRKEATMTSVEYALGVEKAYNYLTKFISYGDMQRDLQCLYYMVNIEAMSKDVQKELIDNGYVFETNFDEGKYQNFENAYGLINVILDYNQSMVSEVSDASELIDVSELCYDENDKALLHDMHVNYYNAYKAGKYYNESFEDNPYYEMVFKQLTTLNAQERAGNSAEASTGAEWIALNVIGGDVMQMLRDHMGETYPRKELDKYFDKGELNQKQWILRTDVSLDINRCYEKPDLESEVGDFGNLWQFVYDDVNNNIMKLFQIECVKSK